MLRLKAKGYCGFTVAGKQCRENLCSFDDRHGKTCFLHKAFRMHHIIHPSPSSVIFQVEIFLLHISCVVSSKIIFQGCLPHPACSWIKLLKQYPTLNGGFCDKGQVMLQALLGFAAKQFYFK